MRKIPTLFVRDFIHGRPVLTDEITPGCEWVLEGTHPATRKYDGTCVLIEHDGLHVNAFTRREVKDGKMPPPNYRSVEFDPVTGKGVGWEPAWQSGFWKLIEPLVAGEADGTYELCGPKINGNPERLPAHLLIRHSIAQVLAISNPMGFESLRGDLSALARDGIEGVVWHHKDGRMAKLKGKDF
jgi:hypothetical protein